MDKTLHPADFSGIIQQLYYINNTALSIYKTHNNYSRDGIIVDELACNYTFGMKTLTHCVKNLLLYIIYSQCKQVGMNNNQVKFFTIESLFSQKDQEDSYALQVWDSIFNENQDYADLFYIIDWVDGIYSSINMYTNIRVVSSDMAVICAVASVADQNISYIFHNHSLRQIMLCLNSFLQSYFKFSGKKDNQMQSVGANDDIRPAAQAISQDSFYVLLQDTSRNTEKFKILDKIDISYIQAKVERLEKDVSTLQDFKNKFLIRCIYSLLAGFFPIICAIILFVLHYSKQINKILELSEQIAKIP